MCSESRLTTEDPGNETHHDASASEARENFIEGFISIVQAEAREMGFRTPENLKGSTQKQNVRKDGGATGREMVQELYQRIRHKLGCNVVHAGKPHSTLGQMALFYFNRLP